MSVRIRLKRIGKNPKGRIHFRIAVYDTRTGRDSRTLEEVGFYNPNSGEAKLNKTRVEYWIKNGAICSNTVKSLLKKQKES